MKFLMVGVGRPESALVIGDGDVSRVEGKSIDIIAFYRIPAKKYAFDVLPADTATIVGALCLEKMLFPLGLHRTVICGPI